MSLISRRGIITGLISLVAAPAIVRASSLMPVKQMMLDLAGDKDFTAMAVVFPSDGGWRIEHILRIKNFGWDRYKELVCYGYSEDRRVFKVPHGTTIGDRIEMQRDGSWLMKLERGQDERSVIQEHPCAGRIYRADRSGGA